MHQPIDTNKIVQQNLQAWHAQTLAAIDGVKLRYRVMRDTVANFHVHEDSSESYFVLSGCVTVDLEDSHVSLLPGQFFTVKPGLLHRARVEGEATLLVFDQLDPA